MSNFCMKIAVQNPAGDPKTGQKNTDHYGVFLLPGVKLYSFCPNDKNCYFYPLPLCNTGINGEIYM